MLEFGDFGVFVLRENFGEDFIDAELGGHRVGDLLSVSCDEYDLFGPFVEFVDGDFGFGTDFVGEGESADDPVVANDEEDGAALVSPVGESGS